MPMSEKLSLFPEPLLDVTVPLAYRAEPKSGTFALPLEPAEPLQRPPALAGREDAGDVMGEVWSGAVAGRQARIDGRGVVAARKRATISWSRPR